MARYDEIGIDYNKNRKCDVRISKAIIRLLDIAPGSSIADIGAGAGNYANALADAGHKLIAIEPSKTMLHQSVFNHNVIWLQAVAESIPLQNDTVDGVIANLSIHHFTSLQDAIFEVQRICPEGPLVIFTLDPRESEESWFQQYFPEIHQQDFDWFPPIAEITNLITSSTGWTCEAFNYPLPCDLQDLNMYSGWSRPEIYLDPHVRKTTSGFALAPPSVVNRGLMGLQNDLHTGIWDDKYGHFREKESFDAGFTFLKCQAWPLP